MPRSLTVFVRPWYRGDRFIITDENTCFPDLAALVAPVPSLDAGPEAALHRGACSLFRPRSRAVALRRRENRRHSYLVHLTRRGFLQSFGAGVRSKISRRARGVLPCRR